MFTRREAERVREICQKIGPLLTGHSSPIQGAVIADLLARWLAGHVIVGDPEGSARMRETLLKFHVEAVLELTKLNASEMGT